VIPGPPDADVLHVRSVTLGSEALLKALWREHPGILHSFHQRGYAVARPKDKS
jgi:hypothetical protein